MLRLTHRRLSELSHLLKLVVAPLRHKADQDEKNVQPKISLARIRFQNLAYIYSHVWIIRSVKSFKIAQNIIFTSPSFIQILLNFQKWVATVKESTILPRSTIQPTRIFLTNPKKYLFQGLTIKFFLETQIIKVFLWAIIIIIIINNYL